MNILKQLKIKDIKGLKEIWHKEQNMICPILKNIYDISKMTLDHQHKLKSEEPDETGKGLCRGVIHFQANMLEGKILKSFKRCGLSKHIDLISFLRNLADYLENNKIHTKEKYIHPTEAPKKPVLLVSSYNKLVKEINNQEKVPPYIEKKGNLSKLLQRLFDKYKITPKFRK